MPLVRIAHGAAVSPEISFPSAACRRMDFRGALASPIGILDVMLLGEVLYVELVRRLPAVL